jgi:predicted heme/steroid binding protein
VTLSTGGPFTVFAPTNAAFDALIALLETDVNGLLARDDLKDILLYHVVDGQVLAAAVVGLITAGSGTASVPTLLADASLTLTLEGNTVKINDTITVSQTDIIALNGVIHVIDGVLLPPAPEPQQFNVRFNGFEGVLLSSTSYTEGTTLSFPTAPSIPGYTFEGWDDDGSAITQDITIQANYEKIYFTLSQLSQFTGKDGNDAYIGYKGVVYDVTGNPFWPNGTHQGYINAGQDITTLFASSGSSHGDSNITTQPIVGFIQTT